MLTIGCVALGVIALILVIGLWPSLQCPQCGSRNTVPSTILMYHDCLSCHQEWDEGNRDRYVRIMPGGLP